MKVTSILVPKPNKKGLCPVKLRITDKGRRTFISTGIRVLPSQWDGEKVKGTPAAKVYNEKITTMRIEAETRLLKGGLRSVKKETDQDFIKYAFKVVGEIRRKDRTKAKYRTELHKVRNFAGGSLYFSEIDHSFLRRYESFLSETLAPNTINKSFQVLDFFLNKAVKDKVIDVNPTVGYDKPQRVVTEKVFLFMEEVEKIEALLELPISETMRRVVLFFLLGCYSGLRVGDWKRFNPSFIQSDRLLLYAKKNGNLVSFQMHSKLKRVVELIGSEGLDISEPHINKYLKSIAKLAGIKKNLTTHVGRFTFATHCATLGINKSVTAELMGISERVVNTYYRLIDKGIDNEVKKWG